MANGSGQRSDRYGRIADNLVSARIAAPSGLWSSENFRHAAFGPWLGGLVAGSEGLFGILTDATLRLHATPEHVEDRAWLLPSFPAAVDAVRQLTQAGHALAMLRISDEAETAFLSQFRLVRDGLAEPPFLERTMLQGKARAASGMPGHCRLRGDQPGYRPRVPRGRQGFRQGGRRIAWTAAGRFLAQVALPGAASAREPDGARAWRRHVRDRGAVVEP